MQLRFAYTSVALCATLLYTNAYAIPVNITLGTAYAETLGADPGYTYDAIRLNGVTSNLNLNYGQSGALGASTIDFFVGDTGPSSAGRFATFVLSRDISVNGQAGSLLQSGSVSIGVTDTFNLQNTQPYSSNLVNGNDHYSVSVSIQGLYGLTLSGGVHSLPAIGQVSLTNIEDAPIASLTGSSQFSFGNNLSLDASLSFDPDQNGSITTYRWDVDNDGVFELTAGASLDLSKADYQQYFSNATGQHTIGLKVTDNTGRSSVTSFNTTLLAAPVPEPETVVMLLSGLALLGARARRLLRKAQA